MGRDLKKRIKRRRRRNYLKRLKARAKTKKK